MSDRRLRQLEREFIENPCEETRERYHAAILRSGLCEEELPNVCITTRTSLARGAIRIGFNIFRGHNYCPLNCFKSINMGLRYGLNNGPPVSMATLAGATANLSIDRNVLTINTDPEDKTCFVEWDCAADGIAAATLVTFTFEILPAR